MRPVRDPEDEELSHLVAACALKDKAILEIGVGDGKFASQYADLSRSTIGIDPEVSDLQSARQDVMAKTKRVSLVCGLGENLPFPTQMFDIALFACSL